MKIFLYFIFQFLTCSLLSQSFLPPIKNYTIDEYLADNQNWGIDVNNSGEVFVANNKGLLRFNGQKWQLHELPNKTIVRSVLCDKDKIYTGSYEEFGYWKKDNFGIYKYTSLFNLIQGKRDVVNEQFWNIVKHNNKIYFRSFARGLYYFDGKNIKYVENSQGVSNEVIYKNKILFLDRAFKIKILKSGKFVDFSLPKFNLNNLQIKNLSAKKDKLFFFGNNQGYILIDDKLQKLPNKLNLYLTENTLNKISFISENSIVFGTIKKGIIIYNYITQKTQFVEKKDGLQNNTVLGFDYANGSLWIALDNGITQIKVDTPLSFYKDNSGVLGTVYDVAFFKNKTYLASNTGVYTFSEDKKLEFLENSEGQTWGLSVVENNLIANHTDGSFIISENKFAEQLNDVGVFCTVKNDDVILQGTYFGINYLKLENGKWFSRRIENIPFLVDNIVFETKNIIWISHPHKGVYRIKLNENFTQAIEINSFGNDEKFKQYKTVIFKEYNEILFLNAGNYFYFDKLNNQIKEYKKLENIRNKNLLMNNKEFWAFDKLGKNSLILLDRTFNDSLYLNISSVNDRLVSKYEKIGIKNDSIRFINLNDGFATFNIKNIVKNQTNETKAVLERIYSPTKNIEISTFNKLEVSYKSAQLLTFEIYQPYNYNTSLNYILEGQETASNMVNDGNIVLQNLEPGNYTLSIINESKSKETKKNLIRFKVSNPWYLSPALKISYFIIILIIIWIIYNYSNKRIKAHQLQLKKEYIKKTQERINKIEKENLEKEISTKQRELINSTTSIMKRNEIILSLRGELRKLLQYSNNKIRTENLIKLSKEKIEDEKEWKSFEDNFKKLHDDFFKRLIYEYPKLTTKDLKLCAYIKMGFSSKDIAPLLGITLRGVEVHRYRLRKKLKLDTNENIHNFLLVF